MSETGGKLWFRRDGRATVKESLREALVAQIEPGETVVRGVRSADPIVHEHGETEDVIRPAPDDSTVAVVSDRRLYFAVGTAEGPEVITIPYRDVRSVDVDDGLFTVALTVRVWNRGYFRFSPVRGEDVTAVGDTVEQFVRGWQRVLAALEAARELITELGRHVEEGNEEDAAEAREAVQRELSRAGTRIDEAPEAVRDALEERVEEVTTELQRRRLRAHAARGKDLASTGEALSEEKAWDEAGETFRRAREHLETALAAAIERGFDVVDALRSEIDEVEAGQRRLAERPLELGEESRAVAQAADETAAAVSAWDDSVTYYRAALTAASREALVVHGETDGLRWQVEWAAGNLIEARRERARELEERADGRRTDGDAEASREDYRKAADHLDAAADLAGELRVGDPDRIRAQRDWLEEKLASA